MNLCTTIQNHHLVYLLALQLRRVGQDGRVVRIVSVCPCLPLAAFPWLDQSSLGVWTLFQGPGVQKVFPFTHIPNKPSGPGCWDNNQSSLFAEIRSRKIPTAEQGLFTMSVPEEGCVINLELMDFVIILRIFIVQISRVLPLSFMYCWTYGGISCILCKRQLKFTMLT